MLVNIELIILLVLVGKMVKSAFVQNLRLGVYKSINK